MVRGVRTHYGRRGAAQRVRRNRRSSRPRSRNVGIWVRAATAVVVVTAAGACGGGGGAVPPGSLPAGTEPAAGSDDPEPIFGPAVTPADGGAAVPSAAGEAANSATAAGETDVTRDTLVEDRAGAATTTTAEEGSGDAPPPATTEVTGLAPAPSDGTAPAEVTVSEDVPDIAMLDLAAGSMVSLRSVVAGEAPLLFWFWSPL